MKQEVKLADSTEPKSIVEQLLKTNWVRKRLKVGDYIFECWDGIAVCVTRKTISDLLSSINANFGDQLAEMTWQFSRKIILLEGNWRVLFPKGKLLTDRGVERATWNTIWNFLRTWQDRGFTIELTINNSHTVNRLNSLYTYYQKTEHTGGITCPKSQ